MLLLLPLSNFMLLTLLKNGKRCIYIHQLVSRHSLSHSFCYYSISIIWTLIFVCYCCCCCCRHRRCCCCFYCCCAFYFLFIRFLCFVLHTVPFWLSDGAWLVGYSHVKDGIILQHCSIFAPLSTVFSLPSLSLVFNNNSIVYIDRVWYLSPLLLCMSFIYWILRELFCSHYRYISLLFLLPKCFYQLVNERNKHVSTMEKCNLTLGSQSVYIFLN